MIRVDNSHPDGDLSLREICSRHKARKSEQLEREARRGRGIEEARAVADPESDTDAARAAIEAATVDDLPPEAQPLADVSWPTEGDA